MSYLLSHDVLETQFCVDAKRTYNIADIEVFVPEQPPKPVEILKGVTDGITYIEGYNVKKARLIHLL